MNPTFSSTPVNPPPITQATADVTVLNTLPTFRDRATFQLSTGLIAPPFDPSQPARNWCDTSAKPSPYLILKGQGASATLVSTPAPPNVRLPNFASPFVYAPWVNAPSSPATLWGNPFVATSLLISLDAANALAKILSAAIGAPVTVAENTSLEANGIEWNGETRRIENLNFNGISVLAGPLAQTVFAKGYDSQYGIPPGDFTINENGISSFIFRPDPVWSEAPILDTPKRALAPGESFQAGFASLGTQVVNMSLLPAAATAGGGFSDADRKTLQANHLMLLELCQAFSQQQQP